MVPICAWLTAADSHSLALWCKLVVEAERSVGKMSASRLAQLRSLGSDLALTPASRARLGPMSKVEDPNPAAAEFFD